jgi:hypothetical protein
MYTQAHSIHIKVMAKPERPQVILLQTHIKFDFYLPHVSSGLRAVLSTGENVSTNCHGCEGPEGNEQKSSVEEVHFFSHIYIL